MIFAISSACPGVIVQPQWCLALAKQQLRLAAWWDIEPWTVEYTMQIGQFDDPGGVDVQIVPQLADPRFIAEHTVINGRPVCFVSWAAVLAEGGSLVGPNGLVSAISHEACESRVNPTCRATVTNPAGQQEPKECCDRIQGTDYEEDGSPGIFLSNALGPAAFTIGATRAKGLDIASDLHTSSIVAAFPLTPGGYYAPEGAPFVYGRLVSALARARCEAQGPRGGAIVAARGAG